MNDESNKIVYTYMYPLCISRVLGDTHHTQTYTYNTNMWCDVLCFVALTTVDDVCRRRERCHRVILSQEGRSYIYIYIYRRYTLHTWITRRDIQMTLAIAMKSHSQSQPRFTLCLLSLFAFWVYDTLSYIYIVISVVSFECFCFVAIVVVVVERTRNASKHFWFWANKHTFN